MRKTQLTIAAFIGFLGVAIGAMGAHALKNELGPIQLNSYLTGVRYLFIHVLAILITYALSDKINTKLSNIASWLFLVGIVFFCGSIFLLSTISVHGIEGMRALGPVTPIGGLFFMAGWLLLAISTLKSN